MPPAHFTFDATPAADDQRAAAGHFEVVPWTCGSRFTPRRRSTT